MINNTKYTRSDYALIHLKKNIKTNCLLLGGFIGLFFTLCSNFVVGYLAGGAIGYAIGSEIEKRYS